MSNLLDKRIICTTDYMDNIFGVNQIIPLKYNDTFSEWEYADCSRQILLSHFLKYSQFRELQWWEQREISELPMCVRFGEWDKQHAIYKIISWNTLGDDFKNHEPCGYAERPTDYFISLQFPNNFPATPEEYSQYIKSK